MMAALDLYFQVSKHSPGPREQDSLPSFSGLHGRHASLVVLSDVLKALDVENIVLHYHVHTAL